MLTTRESIIFFIINKYQCVTDNYCPKRGLMKFLSTKGISGRSILEMLGVLAIIGILSLTALWGYPVLITRHRANEIIANVVQPQIILTLAQKGLEQKPAGILHFDVDTRPYEQYAAFALEKTSKGTLKLSVMRIESNLCKKIVEQLLPEEPNIEISVNETNRNKIELCALDQNTVSIYFPQEMTLPNPDTPCGNNPCGENFVCDAATNKCVCNQLLDKNGSCLPCSTSSNIETSKNDCAKCKNRTYQEDLCLLSCDNGQIRGDDLKCYNCSTAAGLTNVDLERCLTCIGQRFWNAGTNTCWSCDDKTPRYSDEGLGCTNCPNRFLTSNNLCVWCDAEQSYGTTAEQCAACGNKRFYISSSGLCIKRPDCNANQFLDNNGNCRSCDETGYIAAAQQECFKCSNRYSTGDTCGRCEDMKPASNADEQNCMRCPNTAIMGGKCYPCMTDTVWTSSKENCAKCSNRVFDTNDVYFKCHLPCESGTIFSLTADKCLTCRQLDGITAGGKDACLTCAGQRFWNVGTKTCWSCSDPTERRSDEENGCHTCPNRFLRSGSKGAKADYCAPCDLNTDVYAPQANCNRCPTRFYRASDGLCLKPCAAGKVRQPDGTCA